MNVYKPEIVELLISVEKKYARVLRTTTDFESFSLDLQKNFGETISSSTLKRLWGYVNDVHQPRVYTLDLLSRYAGYDNFCNFCRWLKTSSAYNSSFFIAKHISSNQLSVDAEVEIGWSPNRYLRLSYKGNSLFEVVDVKESKLMVGDIFEVNSFILGKPLYLSYVLRNGKRTSPFIAGRNGGLTLVNTL